MRVQRFRFAGLISGLLYAIAIAMAGVAPAGAQQLVKLSVLNGTGAGSFPAGTVVDISATVKTPGYVFSRWSVVGATVADPTQATTKLTLTGRSGFAAAYALMSKAPRMLVPSPVAVTPKTLVPTPVAVTPKTLVPPPVAVIPKTLVPTPVVVVPKPAVPSAVDVTVTGGAGSGRYAPGAKVTITAAAPAAGKVFAAWTGAAVVEPKNAAVAVLTVPNNVKTVAVAASYVNAPAAAVDVTVAGGKGSGKYAPGTKVDIEANAPAAGKMFSTWSGADIVAVKTSAKTTLTVPAGSQPVTVSAVYVDVADKMVTVTAIGGKVAGTASGKFAAGSKVDVLANTPIAGETFTMWTGGAFDTPTAASTKFTVPTTDVTIMAVTKRTGVIDPIFTSDAVAASPFAVLDEAATAVDHLLKAPKPRFRAGYQFPPLTTSGLYAMNPKTSALIAQDFGYAFDGFGNAEFNTLRRDKPGKYKSFIVFNPGNQYFRPEVLNAAGTPYYKTLSADPFLQDGKGGGVLSDPANPDSDRVLIQSPLVPDADWLLIGRSTGADQKVSAGGLPIDIVQNYGEYGPIPAQEPQLRQDPKVLAAQQASGLEWYQFLAREKVRAERLIKQGYLEGLGQKTPPLYIYYTDSFNFSRNSYYTWRDYAIDYAESAKAGFPVSDMPNDQTYYEQFNSGFTGTTPLFPGDMLTYLLNVVAGNRSMGDLRPLYLWSSAGWEGQGAIAEPERYMGFLKMAYSLNVQSTVAGYFCGYLYFGGVDPACPKVIPELRDLAAMGPSPSPWLWSTMLQGHTHALFSHLEGYLNEGDVLSDGRGHPFIASVTEGLPLLELAVENETSRVKSSVGIEMEISTARVVARKLKNEDRFLITAWANTGDDRMVNVTVPGLGRVTVNARKSGAVYLGTIVGGQPNLTLVDENGMNPTARLSPVKP